MDDVLEKKQEELDQLEEKQRSTRATVSQALGQLFGKKQEGKKTKEVGVQVIDEEEEDCDADVDETDSMSGGMHTSASQVEIDIFKYGSRVKQSANSSFLTDAPEMSNTAAKSHKARPKASTGFKNSQQVAKQELT